MLSIPISLKTEREQLDRELTRTIQAGGHAGAAAQRLADLLRPHFRREEHLAFPPLCLLTHLVAGKHIDDAGEILNLTEQLKLELPRLYSEHRAIMAALGELSAVATEAGETRNVHFAERLKAHTRTEEEVLYPAALLVGEFLKTMGWRQEPTPARWPDRQR
jgi:hypothetical protein